MAVSPLFAPAQAAGVVTPTLEHEAHPALAAFRKSECLRETPPTSFTDAEREQAIHAKGAELIAHMGEKEAARRRYEVSSCLTDKADMDAADARARRAWEDMAALIRGRSAEAVALMERELGLV